MKGQEFREIRKSFGLGKADWMYALGYSGNKNTMYLNCERYENGTRPIPLYLARYVWLLQTYCYERRHETADIPMPNWPDWPGYHLDEEKLP